MKIKSIYRLMLSSVISLVLFVEFTAKAQVLNACTEHADCEAEGKHVKCLNKYCQCDTKLGSIRESHSKSCALRIGISCSNSTIPCVNHARCDSGTGTCLCDEPEFSETDYGTCAVSFGYKCEVQPPLECNPFKFLRCELATRLCACAHGDELIYDEWQGLCLARPGERCELKRSMDMKIDCISNATCIPVDRHHGRCACNEGYSPDAGFCKPNLGTPCDLEPWSCVTGRYLTCSPEQICSCSNDAILDFASYQCLPKVGAICHSQSQNCIPNARCSMESKFKCACDPGYIETDDGLCELQPVSIETTEETFINYNASTKSPEPEYQQIKVGQPCTEEMSLNAICTQHSVCEDGLCQCTNSLKPTKRGFCKLGYSERCNPYANPAECDEDVGMDCIKDTCVCTLGRVYDSGRQICVSPPGGQCNVHESDVGCVYNAGCHLQNTRTGIGICSCFSGYEATDDGVCRMTFTEEPGNKNLRERSSDASCSIIISYPGLVFYSVFYFTLIQYYNYLSTPGTIYII